MRALKSDKNEGPVFLVGASRSGTTLLRLMLNQHPEIRIPGEAWFIGDVIQRFPAGKPVSFKELQEICEAILTHDRWKSWECPDERLRQVVMNSEGEGLEVVVDRIFRECGGVGKKSLWGEKSPRHSYLVEKIHEVFPSARFIHIVRDGRDVCAAMIERKWYDGSARRCAMCWSGMVGAAAKAQQFGAGTYRQISFEDLIRNPEETLKGICDFLGVEYVEEMLNYQETVPGEIATFETKIHEKLSRSLDVSEIGRWKKLSFRQLLIIESLAGPLLKEFGYSSGIKPSLGWVRGGCGLLLNLWQKVRELSSKSRVLRSLWRPSVVGTLELCRRWII
jgi:Sulfotransferase family